MASATLYTAGTPNGQKLSMTLEQLGLNYETKHIDISKNTQKEEWYLKINPNGRIPAIIDRTESAEGKRREKRVFEGMAIMLKYWEIVEWMTWMKSGIGLMQGQANRFYRYAPEKIEYAINRYQTEVSGGDKTKAEGGGPWIVGDKLTIADIACFSGLDVPEPFKMKEKMKSKEGEKEFEEHQSKWVMDGQKEDQEKYKCTADA
ncbi:hypothetical protein BKA61DRAFT_637517 [Leptodontidium sp. MPI-SDFR-AT-0119]|nr:hypothetical protein BKA61DRAFT_637517 [Leptodontidium sp. MPI-SDFR-AT-0119]